MREFKSSKEVPLKDRQTAAELMGRSNADFGTLAGVVGAHRRIESHEEAAGAAMVMGDLSGLLEKIMRSDLISDIGVTFDDQCGLADILGAMEVVAARLKQWSEIQDNEGLPAVREVCAD